MMDKAEREAIINEQLPLPIGTRVKTIKYGKTGDEEYKGTIIEKVFLLCDFMYLVEYDQEIPGGFGKDKENQNAWTDRITGLNNLSWEYHPLERAEEE